MIEYSIKMVGDGWCRVTEIGEPYEVNMYYAKLKLSNLKKNKHLFATEEAYQNRVSFCQGIVDFLEENK